MENLNDYTEHEPQLSSVNAENPTTESKQINPPTDTPTTDWTKILSAKTGYEYPPEADPELKSSAPPAENTDNLAGNEENTPENSNKMLNFVPLPADKDYGTSNTVCPEFEPSKYENPAPENNDKMLKFEPSPQNEEDDKTNIELEKKLNDYFSNKAAEPKDEEIPPALWPLFKVADALEAEKTHLNTEATALTIQKVADKTDGNPYAEYLGKGGTIYVHVFDVEENPTYTDIVDSKGEGTLPTRKDYVRAAEICNLKFKAIDVNLKVEIHFAKTKNGQKPLSRKEFQARKNYNPTDSYVVIGQKNMLENWEIEKHRKYKANDNDNYTDGKTWGAVEKNLHQTDTEWDILGVNTVGTSSSSQFFSLIITDSFRGMNSMFGYQEAAKQFGKNEAIAMAIAKFIQHETGHPKFDRDINDDAANIGQGGHVKGTIMQEYPVYGVSEDYSIYQQAILQELHGRLNQTTDISANDWSNFLDSKYILNTIDNWQQKSWKDISISIKNASATALLSIAKNIAYNDLISIFGERTDLPKNK